MIAVVAYLVGLPIALVTFAGFFRLIDGTDRSAALTAVGLRIALVAVLFALAGSAGRAGIVYAFATIAVLHSITYAALQLKLLSNAGESIHLTARSANAIRESLLRKRMGGLRPFWQRPFHRRETARREPAGRTEPRS